MIEITESELIADMKATYPGIHARPGVEFSKDFAGTVWTGGEVEMPDGMPVFAHLCGEDDYDGGVHVGFTAWLERRGWYLENYDGATFLAYPISAVAQMEASRG